MKFESVSPTGADSQPIMNLKNMVQYFLRRGYNVKDRNLLFESIEKIGYEPNEYDGGTFTAFLKEKGIYNDKLDKHFKGIAYIKDFGRGSEEVPKDTSGQE